MEGKKEGREDRREGGREGQRKNREIDTMIKGPPERLAHNNAMVYALIISNLQMEKLRQTG